MHSEESHRLTENLLHWYLTPAFLHCLLTDLTNITHLVISMNNAFNGKPAHHPAILSFHPVPNWSGSTFAVQVRSDVFKYILLPQAWSGFGNVCTKLGPLNFRPSIQLLTGVISSTTHYMIWRPMKHWHCSLIYLDCQNFKYQMNSVHET